MNYTDTQLERMRGPWIRTFTKRIVNPLELTPEDIDIEDIAHHLATFNRFVGALRFPMSIAQHSVNVSRLLGVSHGEDAAMYGLLHDASEAYLGDVSKWLKGQPEMAFYRDAEDRATRVILERFGLNPFDMEVLYGDALEAADRLMVRVEGELGFDIPELIPGNDRYGSVTEAEWREVNDAISHRSLSEMDWRNAKMHFLLEYKQLTRIK